MQRRQFLSAAGASLAAGLASPARAQSTDYRALVCIFLYGGNDGMNMVVPRDAGRHGQYAAVRKALALPQGSLVPLGADYGLHPSMAALAPAWAAQSLAPVFNVGPLYQPLTRDEYLNHKARGKTVPESLFSHHHQQLLWETAHHDASRLSGWGGRAAAARSGTVMAGGGNGRFGLTEHQAALVFPAPGAAFGLEGWFGNQNAARLAALRTLHAESSEQILHNAYAGRQREAMALADQLGPTLRINPKDNPGEAINSAFAPLIDAQRALTTPLARQLYQIAKLIEYRANLPAGLGGSRHIYFATLGGFDTHGNQIGTDVLQGTHANLLKTLADAMAAFHAATEDLGLAANVTTFTQSDFGRTFAPNSSRGTDHAWGNHQLVLGGAVIGNATYGRYPELALGGPDDAGQAQWERLGRWVPTASVDQYAATLLRWWGLGEGQIDGVLPNLRNFGSARGLNFLRA
ncbi:DUF1501 domain-containing protein [Ramlibacter tataouinensis]|uniref:Tat pathway signal protein n=1 Tax=Ramlibacter tataouinensis (strain ATCC BAA-407 / DSM 14655 / LMG 21543 / TTB310) TaxID=365046 RepID=F5Y5D2_RAMTT|nr:DUF1501 domain-containing protein [Ramlibacter tataouinensis]AEG91442.1 Conserved hypothetical protein [Ramlibacter tataouinensis TTB310]